MSKVPKQAERVFKGIIFDVYQWEQTLYDGKTKATFEILKRPDTVVVLAVQDDKILLARDEQPHRPPVITPIAGRLDSYAEIPLEAAKREFLEETGYEATSWEAWKTIEPYHKADWTVHYFIAKGLRKVTEADPGVGEKITVRWVTFDEFIEETKGPMFGDKDLAIELYRMSSEELEAFRRRLFATTS